MCLHGNDTQTAECTAASANLTFTFSFGADHIRRWIQFKTKIHLLSSLWVFVFIFEKKSVLNTLLTYLFWIYDRCHILFHSTI